MGAVTEFAVHTLVVGKKHRIKAQRSTSDIAIIRDYSQRAFFWLHEQLRNSGYTSLPHRIRASFWSELPVGRYSARDGTGFVDDYLAAIEEQIRIEVSRHSLVFWLHVLRRILPSAAGENDDPITNGWVRATFEAAAQKYGILADFDDIKGSHEVSIEEVLNGLLMRSEFSTEREHLQKGPQELVLTKFDTDELRHVYETQKLCYEVWKCMAVRRALGKGAGLQVLHQEPFFHDFRTDELDSLIRSYDERKGYNPATATGTVYTPGDDNIVGLPVYNLGLQEFSNKEFLHKRLGVQLRNKYFPNFLWVPYDLGAFYLAHQFFAPAFFVQYGLELVDVIAMIAALAVRVASGWNEFGEVIRYCQRAYDGPALRDLIVEEIRNALPIAIEHSQVPADSNQVDVERVFDFFVLNPSRRDEIDLGLAGPRAILLPGPAHRYYIDYEPIIGRLHYLFFGLKVDDQNFKGDALENIVRGSDSVLPHASLKAVDGTSKQVDASFAAGETLVIVECRAVARSFGMERGDRAAIQYRNDLVDRTLKDIDAKAIWLREHRDDIPRLKGFRKIMPIGVTPFREFIHSQDSHYWVTKTLPRVMTPSELTAALGNKLFEGECENCLSL
jgi:hypothetical protein